RLLASHKFAHGLASRMPQIRNAIQHRPEWRNMTDRNHRFQAVELMQTLVQLFLRILPGRVKRRPVRIPETYDMKSFNLESATVKIVKSKPAAQIADLLRRFVISRNHVNAIAALLQNFAHGIDASRKVDQIP